MGKRTSRGPRASARPPSGSVSATEAQNNFGRVLGQAVNEGVVYITRYDRPAAVVMSIDEYRNLTEPRSSELDVLTREFDELYAGMQTPAASAAFDSLFEMGSEELGEAAARGALARKK